MSSVALPCLIIVSIVGVDAVATKAGESEVVVGADARQIMRNTNHPSKHVPASQAKTSAEHSSGPAPPASKTVTLNLYYETKCPDCVKFINETLLKMWSNKDLRPFLNITMNPYGNAMSLPVKDVSQGYKFWHPNTTGEGWEYVHVCQHGTDECLGNLIQACAISSVEKDKFMELVFCMAAKPDWSIEKSSYECMASAGIDQNVVKECATSPQGNQLFADFGKLTDQVQGRQGTPWVMINGAHLERDSDLLSTVCSHLGDGGPSSCDPFRPVKKADPSPDKEQGDDGDFTVLPALKKEYVQLSPKNI